jgi:hypothetical protein
MRNLYHIRVIDLKYNRMCVIDVEIQCSIQNDLFHFHSFQAEVKLEYLLNLSILISKGKEIN